MAGREVDVDTIAEARAQEKEEDAGEDNEPAMIEDTGAEAEEPEAVADPKPDLVDDNSKPNTADGEEADNVEASVVKEPAPAEELVTAAEEDEPKNEPDSEMRKRMLDRREKDLIEREENLQKRLLELEAEKKIVSEQKQKLSTLLEQLVGVEESIQDVLGRGSPKEATNSQSSPLTEPEIASPVEIPGDENREEHKPKRRSTAPPQSLMVGQLFDGIKRSQDIPIPSSSGACYLVYEPESSGQLVEYYSKTTPVENAIGRWVPVGSKSISGFKFKSHGDVVIAGCSGGSHGRKNYFSGWCSFVRSACQMQSELIMWDPAGKGLNVDVWLYTKDAQPGKQSVKLEPGQPIKTEGVLGVAVLPKKTQFYDQAMTIPLDKWLGEGFDLGGSVRI